MSSANFTPISARPTFGSKQQNCYASDYILNKKIKSQFCGFKLNKITTNSENNLLLQNKLLRNKKYNKSYNTSNLNINLYTELDLSNVNVIQEKETKITPTTISPCSTFYDTYTIDPSGALFGNTPCGIQNFVHFQVPNCTNVSGI